MQPIHAQSRQKAADAAASYPPLSASVSVTAHTLAPQLCTHHIHLFSVMPVSEPMRTTSPCCRRPSSSACTLMRVGPDTCVPRSAYGVCFAFTAKRGATPQTQARLRVRKAAAQGHWCSPRAARLEVPKHAVLQHKQAVPPALGKVDVLD